MNYIIDGFNLAFKIPNIAQNLIKGQTGLAIKQLTHFVQNKIKNSKSKIIIVFDGRGPHGQTQTQASGIELIFSHKPQTADDIIRDFIRQTDKIGNWSVVSSDNEIIFTAQDHGAKVIKSDEFLKKELVSWKNKNQVRDNKTNPENVDVEYWRKLFESGNKE